MKLTKQGARDCNDRPVNGHRLAPAEPHMSHDRVQVGTRCEGEMCGEYSVYGDRCR